MIPRGPSGGGETGSDRYLSFDNRIQWGALGSAIAGGTVYATFVAWIEGSLSILTLPSRIATGILDGADGQLDRFLTALRADAGAIWGGGTLDMGLFQLPFNVLLFLVVLSVVALVVRMWRS
ncbi:hypothetical protein [Halarchaeum sp. P4]|uniref:hypothetical protein n=1 Tax=Halarchaeum sp. P4 TaxID=3421639 RepID=UPI003EBF21DE